MYYASFQNDGYSQDYIASRNQVDRLCDLMVLGILSYPRVMDEYRRIEAEFAVHEPEMMEFFRMVYKSRLERLADQFIPEKI